MYPKVVVDLKEALFTNTNFFGWFFCFDSFFLFSVLENNEDVDLLIFSPGWNMSDGEDDSEKDWEVGVVVIVVLYGTGDLLLKFDGDDNDVVEFSSCFECDCCLKGEKDWYDGEGDIVVGVPWLIFCFFTEIVVDGERETSEMFLFDITGDLVSDK